MRRSTGLVLAGVLAGVLNGQPRPDRMTFEVASVKVVPITEYGASEETPNRVRYRWILPLLVQRAYEIKPYQLENQKLLMGTPLPLYEIQATLPPGAKHSDIPAMLRSLLEDRFHFSAHWQEKPIQVYRLEVDPAGLKLKPLELGEKPPDTPVKMIAVRQGLVKFRGVASLQDVAEFLNGAMDHPVLDRTGTAGMFHIALDARAPGREIDLSGLPLLSGRGGDGTDSAGRQADKTFNGETFYGDAPDIGVALKKLGLRLEKARENVRMLVVDSVNLKPVAN